MSDLFRRCTKVDFVEATPAVPPATSTVATEQLVGNAAFASLEKKALLVGGYSPEAGTGITQVLEYDLLAKQWTNLTAAIPMPTSNLGVGAQVGVSSIAEDPRQAGLVGCKSEAVMVAVAGNNTYYVFGGYNNESGEVVTDMWKLTVPLGESAAKGTWSAVSCAGGPCPRRGHSMAVFNAAPPGLTSAGGARSGSISHQPVGEPQTTGASKIYLFGGFDGTTRLNDLWAFDVDDSSWTCLEAEGSAAQPAPRDSASLCVDSTNNQLVLYGGYASCRSGELFTFDLESNIWTNIPVDQGPTPRMGCFAAYNSGFVVTGLGQDVKGASNLIAQYNCELKKWTVPTVDGDEVEPLIQYSWCLSDNGKRVLVYGGTNEKKYSSALYEFELEKMESAAPVKGGKK